jgi:hypothetical protein
LALFVGGVYVGPSTNEKGAEICMTTICCIVQRGHELGKRGGRREREMQDRSMRR